MSVEGVLFYGVPLAEDDPAWQRLRSEHGDDIGRLLVDRFHAHLLQDREWLRRFKRWGGDYASALAEKLPAEEVFGGCHINSHGDLRQDSPGHYAAVYDTEIVGRTEGAGVDPDLLNTPDRSEWDARLQRFCARLGVGFSKPGWQLVFWWC